MFILPGSLQIQNISLPVIAVKMFDLCLVYKIHIVPTTAS